MNNTPPHFTWRPRLSNATRQSFARADERLERLRGNQISYATALYKDPGATLDDLSEAVTTLEEIERTARRVLGGAHPTTTGMESCSQEARATLAARETPSASK